MSEMLLRAGRAFVDGRLVDDTWIRCAEGRIAEVGTGTPPRTPDVDLQQATLVPGFVDLHCHGGVGTTFDDDAPEWDRVLSFHSAHGTLHQAISLVTAPLEQLLPRVAAAAAIAAVDERVLGIHLEGPFLSHDFRGAHDPEALQAPTASAIDRLLKAGDGHVMQVTIAPELDGAIEAIRRFVDAGVRVAVGHTGADADTVRAAFDAGATLLTHACNGMPPMHHRSPGPLPVALLDERVTLEAIADGTHVDPAVLALLERAAPGRIALITDAMAAAGMPDGTYALGGREVLVDAGVPRIVSDGAIAGSTLTLDRAVQVLVAAGVPLATAIQAATRVPADAIGRSDLGRLEAGARADLVALGADLLVQGTWWSGMPLDAA